MSFKVGILSGALVGSLAFAAVAQEAAAPDRVEMVKESFAASKKALRSYQWIQTVGLSIGGEEKAKQQYTCYYGAEGSLQKVPVAADAKEEKKRGLRGKVVESKKAELEGSLKSAMALLDQYTPVDPAKIQAAKAAGNVSVSVPDQSGRVRVTIQNYVKPGDQVEVAVDGAKNTLQGVKISSMLDDKSPVTANVTYASFPDGTQYPETQVLDLKSQKLSVNVTNSGYKKQSQ
ncbi:MAG: hypothetical protein ACREOU_00495 [Candidatus Eiseniibacteriota bacterium]